MSRKREADFPTDTEQQRAAQRGAMGVELNWRVAAAEAAAVQRQQPPPRARERGGTAPQAIEGVWPWID